MATLDITSGAGTGQAFPLDRRESIIGRHPDSTIVIDSGAVSRHHAQITRLGSRYFIEDLGSRNGTFRNGAAVQGRTLLKDGDSLQICDVSFAFRDPESPGAQETLIQEESSIAVIVDDQEKEHHSTIMSSLDVSSSFHGNPQIRSSAESKLSALLEITRSLSRAISLDEVFPKVLESLFQIFLQADRGFIVMREDDGTLIPRWNRFRRESDENDMRISRTILNHVMNTQEAVLSSDAVSDERFDMSQSIADFRIRSLICAPLIDSEGQTIGALQIDTQDLRKSFHEKDLDVLASVASQAAISIDNARLYEQALQQRDLERDLKVAYDVQQGFLPQSSPNLPGYVFFDYYKAANHVGGDYFDYIQLPDGRLAVLVGDVVGHGVAAALMMAKLSAEIRFQLASELNPAQAISQLNNAICALELDRFVTLVLCVINPVTHIRSL